MSSVRNRRHARGIEPTSVLQLVLRVEAEEVGRALSVIGARHLLVGVDDVRKAEAVPRCKCLHVVEGVLGIALGVIWHNGDRTDTDLA
jgi:hypothetical protein